jgi:hypothetical protein
VRVRHEKKEEVGVGHAKRGAGHLERKETGVKHVL